MKTIPLTKGHSVIVDDDVFEWVGWIQWRFDGSRYAVCNISKNMRPRFRRSRMFMHNLVIGEPPIGMVVDHIDGNGLDCRRENLRVIPEEKNAQNRGADCRNKSGFKGASPFYSQGEFKKWRACIRVDNKLMHLGLFDDVREAAECYNRAAKVYHGEYARLNQL
jgi:hypothetical protein